MRRLAAIVASAAALAMSAAPVAAAETYEQPGGVMITPESFEFRYIDYHDASYGAGVSLNVTLTDVPAGGHELHAQMRYELTMGCLTRKGRSVRPFEVTHDGSVDAYYFTYGEAQYWEGRQEWGTPETFGFGPRPIWDQQPDCPRGLNPGIVSWEPTSATVQFTYVSPDWETRLPGTVMPVDASISWSE